MPELLFASGVGKAAAQPSGVRFNGGPVFKTDGYMTDYLTDEAIAAMEANRTRPFFMYLAPPVPQARAELFQGVVLVWQSLRSQSMRRTPKRSRCRERPGDALELPRIS